MRQRVEQNLGATAVIALAAATIVLYSLWGASLMRAQEKASAQGSPAEQLAVK